ncbi:PD-(D/E)XK motif protein [Aquabacterium sp.]|uniref:PD-(D/E)XK motif protein n=1 Tax=Aquabacterium sp. TaxID=1872578 RepID=UPI0025BE792E|nr:PD-(D/E)XK motif protein [Aquabacterium sp.]
MTLMIESHWQDLQGVTPLPAHRRLNADSKLDLFAQVDSQGQPGLLAISRDHPGTCPAYTSVEVSIARRQDGAWATSLSLTQPSLIAIFAAMCNEIAREGLQESMEANAGTFMLRLLARWQRLLALGADGLLSQEAALGLHGELSLLLNAIDQFGTSTAVNGWTGPKDAPQDFLLPPGFIEVKSIRSGSPEIKISSLEQLDGGNGSITLHVREYANSIHGTGGTSLGQTVRQVRDKLKDDPTAALQFEALLKEAGYTDRSEYFVEELRLTRTTWYKVDEMFPCLPRSKVPASITKGRYSLQLAQLDAFITDTLI